jgi:iron complex outermembrane receptor protein
MLVRFLLLASAAASAIGMSSIASAQSGPTSTGASASTAPAETKGAPDAAAIGDIVVTATLQSTRLQATPVAVSAITPATIKQTQLTDNRALQILVPSLTFTSGPSVNTASFALRGVGTESTSILTEQSVSLVIDGVVQGIQGQALGQLVDIKDVEILRGPQGMLFGKNASAGVINVATNDPQLGNYALIAHGSYATHNTALGQVTVNIPVSDDQALRVSAFGNHRDGLFYNATKDRHEGNDNAFGFRAKYLWEPSTSLRFVLNGDYSKTDQTAGIGTIVSAGPGTRVSVAAASLGITPGRDNLTAMEGSSQATHSINAGVSLTSTLSLGDYKITSITAYRHYQNRYAFDPDQSPALIVAGVDDPQRDNQVSEELRLNSPTGKRFEYVAGLFYFRKNIYRTELSYGTFNTASPPRPAGFLASSDATTTLVNASYAAFGRGTLHITDKLDIFAGARYTKDDYTSGAINDQRPGFVGLPPTFVTIPSSQKGSASNDNVSWQAGAQYQFTHDAMAYFSATRGYKGPVPLNSSPTSIGLSKPEIPMSYELGVKTAWLDRKLTFNVTLFHAVYKDFQAAAFDFQATPPVARITNAGSLVTKGIELDTALRPFTGFTISANAAYLQAHYRKFVNDSCWLGQTAAEGCLPTGVGTAVVTDSSGNRLPNAPHWTVSSIASYTHPLSERLDGFVTANYYYKSRVFWASNNSPFLTSPHYSTLGASVGVGSSDERWRVSLFAKNMFNKHYAARIQDVAAAQRGDAVQFIDPEAYRYVGMSFDLNL